MPGTTPALLEHELRNNGSETQQSFFCLSFFQTPPNNQCLTPHKKLALGRIEDARSMASSDKYDRQTRLWGAHGQVRPGPAAGSPL